MIKHASQKTEDLLGRFIENVFLFSKPGKWRICADHGEMKFDLKTTSAVEDFEIRGHQWYNVFDYKQMKYLQVSQEISLVRLLLKQIGISVI